MGVSISDEFTGGTGPRNLRPVDPEPGKREVDDDLREGMHSGQLRMAYRLANSAHRDKLLHVYGVGWHRWDGKRWAADDQGHAVRAVRDVLRRALQASLDLESDAAKAIRRDVDKCSSATGAAGVLSLAASMAPFAATVRDLDRDPYVLNVANGTLDLRTMTLREHDPADRITKVTAAAYHPDVDATAWDTFLERVLPDEEVRAFLQRLAGVALLGRVVEHVLGILVGTGANGKGAFTRALEHALGDYAASPEADLFMQRDGAHPTGQMDLLGLRWATVSETDQGRRLAEATMKRLTGGDPIRARRMRQDFIEFQPSHTAVLVTNHLPAVRGDDPAIWRRLRLVPFDVVIPEAERDKHLDEHLQLQAEAVLSWAVDGYRDYTTRGGLGEPAAVTAATDAYQLDSDPVARFIADECIPSPHGYTAFGELYERWQRWAAVDGAAATNPKSFGDTLERKGYPADRVRSGRIRRGLLLAEAGEETHDR
jgi:putative DNA primase/helicase